MYNYVIHIYMNTKITGNKGENLASNYIKSKGIEIIDKNFSTRYGEIDIIGVKRNIVYFFEVKYRLNFHYGYGEESITTSKVRKLRQSIEIWLTRHRDFMNYDKYLNAIIISPDNQITEFEIL